MIKDGVTEAALSPYNNGLLLVAKKAARPGAPPSGMRVVLDARVWCLRTWNKAQHMREYGRLCLTV